MIVYKAPDSHENSHRGGKAYMPRSLSSYTVPRISGWARRKRWRLYIWHVGAYSAWRLRKAPVRVCHFRIDGLLPGDWTLERVIQAYTAQIICVLHHRDTAANTRPALAQHYSRFPLTDKCGLQSCRSSSVYVI